MHQILVCKTMINILPSSPPPPPKKSCTTITSPVSYSSLIIIIFACPQGHLIDALKAVHLQLSGARERYEKELERKQRSVARYICAYVCRQSTYIYLRGKRWMAVVAHHEGHPKIPYSRKLWHYFVNSAYFSNSPI